MASNESYEAEREFRETVKSTRSEEEVESRSADVVLEEAIEMIEHGTTSFTILYRKKLASEIETLLRKLRPSNETTEYQATAGVAHATVRNVVAPNR